jgi:hypothetical protein
MKYLLYIHTLMTILQSHPRSFNLNSFEEIQFRLTVCFSSSSLVFANIIDPCSTAVNFAEFDREPSGQVNLIGRVK